MLKRLLLATLITTSWASAAWAYAGTTTLAITAPISGLNLAQPSLPALGTGLLDLRIFNRFKFSGTFLGNTHTNLNYAPRVFLAYRVPSVSPVWRSLSADGCGGILVQVDDRSTIPTASGVCNIHVGALTAAPVQIRIVFTDDGVHFAPEQAIAPVVQFFTP